ncbi:uncharacterized protein [Ptychodera flava]|uniref:uncharacterized protein n=1 Tax=Ptychodera flava TaxID=63121 RepID=UPI00396AA9F1
MGSTSELSSNNATGSANGTNAAPITPAPPSQQSWPLQNLQIPESQARRPQQPPEQLQQQQGQRELPPAQQHPSPNVNAVEGAASNNYDRVSSSPPPEYVVDDFSASGSIGLVSVCKKTRAMIIAFMILSIISASLALPILGVISILAITNEYYLPQFAVDMLLLVIAAIETAVGIIASVLCCRAVCYCGSKNVMYGVPLQIQTLGDGTSNNSIRLEVTLVHRQMATE